ncbi:GspH/FimT family pseudopilin [Pseudomonas sp. NCCP-436]|uniref:GspH/FimT family pseudopilin n=1 Tax=Pseudomonas sp. NCCP-436 TaxID=2842481 RepID=UPI001C7FD66F|nr:GspH/FimT family pseudopilin [Pseudomonas sp. NCCP-436]GIZ11456.1 type 4 fimbrial biogenesis protein FimT [Pseudomonas sp. NCCP-436]
MKGRFQDALSLTELLVTLAIFSAGLAIAVPAYSTLKLQSQHNALREQLHASLNHARLQAVLRRTNVRLCGSADGLTCDNNWSRGWRIYLPGKTEQTLQIQRFETSSTLRWSGFESSLNFYSNGTTPTGNGRFFQCRDSEISWQLIINRQGRVRQARHAENKAEAHRCSS